MTISATEELAGYEAALERAAFYALPDGGYLRVAGEDRVDYLHRQTSNDVGLLRPDRAVLTVLTSPTARILDVLLLVEEPEAIGVVTLPGRVPASAAYFQSRIFFMDKVTVTNASDDLAQLVVEGPEADRVLEAAGVSAAPALDEVVGWTVEGVEARVVGREGLAGIGYLVLATVSASEALAAALVEAGASPLSGEAYETLRVEAGLPGPAEQSEDHTPLETNLGRAVSDTKGCYTGQEILARQITYDKVTRQMVALRLQAPVSVGDSLLAEGKPVGNVTSTATSPRFGPIALAVVRRPHDEPGTNLSVQREGGESVAEVVPPAFQS